MAINICTIGCGSMASYVHGPSYRKYASLYPDAVLAACCDMDGGKAEAFRDAFGFERCYTDMDLMLQEEQPDAVCLVVPEHLTAALSVAVIERGFPLLTEKPPGLTKEETLRMLSAADRHRVPVRVAFNRRYMPLMLELKRLLAEQFKPSDIRHIQYDFYRVGRADADFSTTAIHGIDAVKYIAGSDYARIRFRYQPIPGYGPETANIVMDCEFESGAIACLTFCPVSGLLAERAAVHADGHSFFLRLPVGNSVDVPGLLQHYDSGKAVQEILGSDGEDSFVAAGFYNENAMFFNDIRNGAATAGDLHSALQSVAIMECLRRREPVYEK